MPQPVFLKDYRKPPYLVPRTELRFELEEKQTTVHSTLQIVRQRDTDPALPLFLNGENLICGEIKLNGAPLNNDRYSIDGKGLSIRGVPAEFTLEIETTIDPAQNKSGEGLYKSGSFYCTQMEAEGFRHVTYFVDRPDALSRFTTTIVANKSRYPVLLSNGNPAAAGELDGGRHFATWEDPFPKPCYLFALVAGDLGCLEDRFITKSGRAVTLRIFVEKGREPLCRHAMESLKKAMSWDEQVFNLEYDLDLYMIVAVSDFNFGAMENKGLNIFNAVYVLADADSASDRDFVGIERVIAHEYFHNWTGNRVTCRDWFQLTLKEGLTVFRDQEFSADMASRPAKRIQDARIIKTVQFLEDSGPNAHPIRPQSYIEINNFYTRTVYDKGAEVIRMVDTLIGRENFVRGIQKYFELYDGQAVTTDDFLGAMEIVSGFDFSQFKRWYDQAGTPLCEVKACHHPQEGICELIVTQSCPPTPGQPHKEPFHFPLSVGLLDGEGQELELQLEGDSDTARTYTKVLQISKPKQSFRFVGVKNEPVPSLLREFSAPVQLRFDYTHPQLELLLKRDPDGYVRYEAAQQFLLASLRASMQSIQSGKGPRSDAGLALALLEVMEDDALDPSLRSVLACPPPLSAVAELTNPLDYETAKSALDCLKASLSGSGGGRLHDLYHALARRLDGPYSLDAQAIGLRALKNLCLAYLAAGKSRDAFELAHRQFKEQGCMTDVQAALVVLCDGEGAQKEEALGMFRKRWRDHSLVMDKWFAAQAAADTPAVLDVVQKLESDPLFDRFNPNTVRALFGSFADNLVHFHHRSGAGYAFIADKILEIDSYNSNLSARLAGSFARYKRLDPSRRERMGAELSRILRAPNLSRGVFEIVSKTLRQGETD